MEEDKREKLKRDVELYIKEACGIYPFPFKAEEAYIESAESLLIESHKRQMQIIGKQYDALFRQRQRLRWLPERVRKWLRGE